MTIYVYKTSRVPGSELMKIVLSIKNNSECYLCFVDLDKGPKKCSYDIIISTRPIFNKIGYNFIESDQVRRCPICIERIKEYEFKRDILWAPSDDDNNFYHYYCADKFIEDIDDRDWLDMVEEIIEYVMEDEDFCGDKNR
jgi:hypothetical protein